MHSMCCVSMYKQKCFKRTLEGGLVAQWLGRRTRDREVVSSIPGRAAIK